MLTAETVDPTTFEEGDIILFWDDTSPSSHYSAGILQEDVTGAGETVEVEVQEIVPVRSHSGQINFDGPTTTEIEASRIAGRR